MHASFPNEGNTDTAVAAASSLHPHPGILAIWPMQANQALVWAPYAEAM
jgi:hypothetical protein